MFYGSLYTILSPLQGPIPAPNPVTHPEPRMFHHLQIDLDFPSHYLSHVQLGWAHHLTPGYHPMTALVTDKVTSDPCLLDHEISELFIVNE